MHLNTFNTEVFKSPVCITGMHRSGTSTVAQILYRLGLYLGSESDLFQGNTYNEDGYFENRHFVDLNQNLLSSVGAGWDYPPSENVEWVNNNNLVAIKRNAKELVTAFESSSAVGGMSWGWKDPRNSLTMPFWLDLCPDLRVVVCLRNPLEIAASLHRRGNSSVNFGLRLWRTYNERLLETIPIEQSLIVDYNRLFIYPQHEIRRILEFSGMHSSDQLISLVRSRVIRGLRHHEYTLDDIRREDQTGTVVELYSRLLNESLAIPLTDRSSVE